MWFYTKLNWKITQSEKIDFSKAKMFFTLNIQMDIQKWRIKVHGKYDSTVSFKASSIVFGTFEKRIKRNFRYAYLVIIPIKATGSMQGMPPLNTNPTKKIIIMFA